MTAALSPDELPFSPAAERNGAPILAVLSRWLPARAAVLEVASGTGQHAARFAAAQPGWTWQPSEAQPGALATLAARCVGLPNVRPPVQLDVLHAPWPVPPASVQAVYAANMVHIAPWEATAALLHGAARCLTPGGLLVLYGPFVVEGEPLAPSNAAFDADLRTRDARWGLRSLTAVRDAAASAGLVLAAREAMPANNLMLRFERSATLEPLPQ